MPTPYDKFASARALALKNLASISDEEDKTVTKAASSDLETPEWQEEEFSRATYGENLPLTIKKALGRPTKSVNGNKTLVSLRLSPEALEYFRATGKGWQTRIDEALREWVAAKKAG